MSKPNSYRIIGTSFPKADARERVTGNAIFSADFSMPGMLHGKVLRSPHPHAYVRHIDYSEAIKIPGVKAIVTYHDLPSLQDGAQQFGGELLIDLEHLRTLTLAREKALFDGHAIAAVAAISADIAEEALEHISVEYDVIEPVETALEAMAPDAPLLHENLYTQTLGEKPLKPSNVAQHIEQGWGDISEGFARSDVLVEHTFETVMVHQGYIEPQACVAQRTPDGLVTVWTSTQGSFNAQRMLATLLQIPLNLLNVVPMEVGGAFGGKIYTIIEPLAIMLSDKTGRPVKMVMSRDEVFRATGPGSPMRATVKVGARRDGHITSAYGELILDAGAFPGSPVAGACIVSFAPYKMDNFKLDAYDVVTNKPRVQAYRAPGGTPAAFAVESVMDEVAKKLGLDPIEFRKINAVEEGDPMTNGRPYNRIGLKEILRRVERHPSWTSPIHGRWRGRGLALGFWQGATLTSTSTVVVNVDGTVGVITGQVDLTGTRTTMQQIVTEELQLPPEDISVRVGDTHSTPYTDLSAGSRSAYTQSVALNQACHEVIRRMKDLAADQLKLDPSDVEYAAGEFWAKGSPEAHISWRELATLSRSRGEGPVCGYGSVTKLQIAPEFALHVADVEVDPDTGKVYVLRYTCFQDVGKALNPQQVEGQIQGGAFQGIGWALSEYYYHEGGKLLNPTLLDYRILTSLDLPMLDTELIEVPASDGPYGVRGVGEVPIVPPAATLANAIANAIGSRIFHLPMTPERVFWTIKESQQTLGEAAAD